MPSKTSKQSKSTAKKSPRRLIRPGSVRFDAQAITRLKTLGLDRPTIDEIQNQVNQDWTFIDHERSVPNAKKRQRQLESLKSAIEKLEYALDGIAERTLRMNWDLWMNQPRMKESLKVLSQQADQALSNKGKSGNPENDLDGLVYRVAVIMHRHGLELKQFGDPFNGVVEEVIRALGEKQASLRVAIDKAWNERPPEGSLARWRAGTIQDLIDFGEDDGEDFDP